MGWSAWMRALSHGDDALITIGQGVISVDKWRPRQHDIKPKTTNAGKDVRNWNPGWDIVGRNAQWCSHDGKSSMEVLQKMKSRTIIRSSNPALGYLSKKLKSGSRRVISTTVFTEEVFTIAKMPTKGYRWIKKIYIHSEILFSLKKKKHREFCVNITLTLC